MSTESNAFIDIFTFCNKAMQNNNLEENIQDSLANIYYES